MTVGSRHPQRYRPSYPTHVPSRSGWRALRIVRNIVLAILLLAIAAALALRWEVGRSLALYGGEAPVAGLSAPVTIDFDGRGVPAIRGESRLDVARATGFVHAQERFFQMDLLRRRAAGELSALLGRAALEIDRQVRVHRFRSVARRVLAAARAEDRAVVEAYTEGVNAGLAALKARPFEYLAFLTEPRRWVPEDSALVILAMFLELNDENGSRESALGVLQEALPGPVFDFFAPQGTSWDAPIAGDPLPDPPMPTPFAFDLRRAQEEAGAVPVGVHRPVDPQPVVASAAAVPDEAARPGRPAPTVTAAAPSFAFAPAAAPAPEPAGPGTAAERIVAGLFPRDGAGGDGLPVLEPLRNGSNNWAVAGSRTRHGGAILANDMHLGHGVPNIWYHAALEWPGAGGAPPHRVAGATLPGAPVIVAGSNGRVAWGFTNSYGDWGDLVVLDPVPGDSGAYRTLGGPARIEIAVETIEVKGGDPVELKVPETIWGPVIDEDHLKRRRAFNWTAHHPEAVDFEILRMETAATLEEALDAANRSGIPPQNAVIADASGRIAWTIMGAIPRRVGFDGRVPVSWADGTRRWDGWLEPFEYPQVIDPPNGILWTANARAVDGAMLAAIGDGGYDLGARARQIRDRLVALTEADEADMLAIQLDDRSLFLERWRALLLAHVLTPAAIEGHRKRAEFRRLVDEDWGGRAEISETGYRLVRAFRTFLMERALAPIQAIGKGLDPRFEIVRIGQREGPLWRLVTERPEHLLDPRFRAWDDALLAAVDAAIEYFEALGPLDERTWGERNTVQPRHPLSLGLPFLGRWLDMPARRLPGDEDMPRVQSPGFGASERMAVSPGREASGYFHMPCGQSGHPLSPHYRDGHDYWAEGKTRSFLPGPAVTTLRLVPGR